jgi:hypothetical protein
MDDKERNKMPINKLLNKAKAVLDKGKAKVKAIAKAPPAKKAEKVPLGTGSLNKAKQVLRPSSRQKQIEDALKKSGVY